MVGGISLIWAIPTNKSLDAIELAVRAGDTYNEFKARRNATRALMVKGEGTAAQTQAAAFLTLGERVRDRAVLFAALHANSFLACVRGDWSKGRQLDADALAVASQDPGAIGNFAMLEYETGNFSQGEVYLERLLEIIAQAPPGPRIEYLWPALSIPYAARISGVPVRLSEAAEAARIILSSPSASLLYTVVARCGLGASSHHTGQCPSRRRAIYCPRSGSRYSSALPYSW